MCKKPNGGHRLSKFSPEKLSVEYLYGVTATDFIMPRCYTLTHSDFTGELLLTIGHQYAWNKIGPNSDEVLGEWSSNNNVNFLTVYVHIDEGEYTQKEAAKRNEIFRRELPLALTAIRYGDRFLFNTYPILNFAPIIITFMSTYPQFARVENWGTFQDYSI